MKTKPATNILQDAEDNWPEDEARGILSFWREPDIALDYTPEEIVLGIKKDAVRMEGFFLAESDGPELVVRFRAALVAGEVVV